MGAAKWALWDERFIQGNVGLQRSRTGGSAEPRGVGEISTQDNATHQQCEEHPQQQQCHPDGPTWTARGEDTWVSTEPLPSAFQTTPMPGHKSPYLPVTRATNFPRPGGGNLWVGMG